MKRPPNRWGAGWPSGVGYKKPPKHTQFQPGKSGNPKGRPRRQKGPRHFLEDALKEVFKISENGSSKCMSAQRVVFKVLVKNAMKGNVRAMTELFKLMDVYGLTQGFEPAMNEMIVKFVGMPEKKT